ncbi:putative spermidine/putrescine transport system permease protein [Allocatelliglobosispora scoriae]|uniref:Putative spermidine/putrescine transport system permease protein n=1 Tax=Allocatelliglobosispora scoriae TaxID=643052 RepID=A0A841BLV1_9ACTN|nr:ABC transporter permease subunit [Allocatelliglobosispora scoriae]MBB5867953.1 putative spermidine/putrescine transport system permease protein [Allocatelliglobosispora scoriae]
MAAVKPNRWWHGLVLGVAGLYFGAPLVASLVFSIDIPGQGVTAQAYTGILDAPGFLDSLWLSLLLAASTIVLVLALTVPAMVAARLRPGRLGSVLEVVCTLPLVVPPIAFVAGIGSILRLGPDRLSETPLYQTFLAVQDERFPIALVLSYTILALPFVYRSLDAGLRTLDVVTLTEAARNCGASPWQVLRRVLLPNLRSSLASAAFLTLALVLGEYTIARILTFETFPVWIVKISGSEARLSVAVSLLSLLITWLLLLALSSAGTKTTTSEE